MPKETASQAEDLILRNEVYVVRALREAHGYTLLEAKQKATPLLVEAGLTKNGGEIGKILVQLSVTHIESIPDLHAALELAC